MDVWLLVKLNVGRTVSETLLWVNHVPLCRNPAGQQILDVQTCDLLHHLSQEFDRIILGCIVWDQPTEGVLTGWQPIEELDWGHRLEILALPCAYRSLSFIRHYAAMRSILKQAVERADYLCFLPASFIGDWAGVACLEAIAQGRPFAIWNDRIERDVIQQSISSQPYWKRGLVWGLSRTTGLYNHALMKRATLGLLQGHSCRAEFAPDLERPDQHMHCFNYINTKPEDAISAKALEDKLQSLAAGEPLRIGYVGRAAEMKGALDWLSVLAELKQQGVAFQATWIGSGPLLDAMQQRIEAEGLTDQVTLPGAIADRQQLLALTQDFHLILCCHRTAESARCLQEALVCGCPIVAYDSDYVSGLLEQYHCGQAKPLGDHQGLADLLASLDGDRPQLQTWMRSAAAAGASLNAEATFRQVGQLIKQHLSPEIGAQRRVLSSPALRAGSVPGSIATHDLPSGTHPQ
jgi:glycosyltransferase involved in cell wall biosynthesis